MTDFALYQSNQVRYGRSSRIVRGYFIPFVAILYGLVLASLPVDAFLDRDNYLNYIDYSLANIVLLASDFGLNFIVSEPIWLLLNYFFFLLFSPDDAIRFYVLISASTFSFYFLRQDPRNFIWLVVILLSPLIIKNFIIHLRQGVAISVFFAGWCYQYRKRGWALMLLAPFIHGSFFLVLPFLVLSVAYKKLKLSANLQLVISLLFTLMAVTFTNHLAVAFGARQVHSYDIDSVHISGLGFVFWLAVLFLFLVQGVSFIKRNSFAIGMLMFYLFAYFSTAFSSRIFESAVFIVLFCGIAMRSRSKYIFIGMVMFHSVVFYTLRSEQPWLGFGL